jgi:hypothetical protein
MHDLLLLQPVSIATFLANYKAGNYVLQVHVSDVDTNLHCIAVQGQQVVDPEDRKEGKYVLQVHGVHVCIRPVSSRPIGQHLASTERGVVCSARDRPSYLVN